MGIIVLDDYASALMRPDIPLSSGYSDPVGDVDVVCMPAGPRTPERPWYDRHCGPTCLQHHLRKHIRRYEKILVFRRAHSSAPDHPPLEKLLGFLEAPIDKLKDAFAKFPTEEMKAHAKEEL